MIIEYEFKKNYSYNNFKNIENFQMLRDVKIQRHYFIFFMEFKT